MKIVELGVAHTWLFPNPRSLNIQNLFLLFSLLMRNVLNRYAFGNAGGSESESRG